MEFSRITTVAPFSGLRRFPQGSNFKQWMGDDSKARMKVFIPAIEGFVPQDMICVLRYLLEFCYLVRHNILTEKTLTEIQSMLEQFHHHHEVFRPAVIASFNYHRQYLMKHYGDMIHLFGAPNGLCSSITESKHIKAMKEPYCCSNRHNALGQMLLTNQQLNKLAVCHMDFQRRGILQGTCTSASLNACSVPPDGDPSSDMENKASEAKAGDDRDNESKPIDIPMSIKAHVVLPHVPFAELAAELGVPRLKNMIQQFMHLTKNPEDPWALKDIPLSEFPSYDGRINIFNSASTTFYAPSDISGHFRMKHKIIHSNPTWRSGPGRYDCTFVTTDPMLSGMEGLDVVCILITYYLCAVVRWFVHGDVPDEDTGIWVT
ncbi:hypothetical protein V8E55_011938 [Tylopilus felleus]